MPEKRTLENDEVVKRQNGVVSRLKKNGMDQHTNVEQHHDEDEGMGEFEDDWEDDQEGDEEDGDIVIAPDSEDEEDMDIETAQMQIPEQDDDEEANLKVYLPGEKLEEGEVLVPDNSAYELLHTMNVEWPCLSFDVLRDNMGPSRSSFPATTYVVAGSQAVKPIDNKIYIMKMSQLHKTKFDDDDEMDEDDGDNDLDEDPILEYKTVPHFCGINRIRVMPHSESHIVSTWSEAGKVHIWDITQHVQSLDTPGLVPNSNLQPIYNVEKHARKEGYGMDWSSIVVGNLLTGDCTGKIFLTSRSNSSFVTDEQPFTGHKGSVEDLQWSPSEKNVFASAGVDGTIKIWDTRKKKPALSVSAHDMDVNVISWNRSMSYLLASGSDSGEFSVWDLRSWSSTSPTAKPAPAASFKWHNAPITSLEWHPADSSMLAVSGADDQITLWDLALETDAEEQGPQRVETLNGQEIIIPPQLLFIHQGQSNVKELHFHQQIPGMIISTSLDGFNIFKTINS